MNTSENNDNNKNILISVVIILLVIIAVLGFFLWKNIGSSQNNDVSNKINTPINNKPINNNIPDTNIAWTTSDEKIIATVYDDKRCTSCQTEQIITQLKQIPSLSTLEFVKKDFFDEWVEKYLKDNGINILPAIIFNKSNIDQWINSHLTKITSWEYSLQLWSSFNPYAERSDNWFLVIETEKIKKIKDSSYIKWNSEAKITWLEYSDLECPYCAKLHNAWTIEAIEEKYSDKVNLVFNHFPLGFHANAQIWGEILECAWEEKGSDIFYKLLSKSYKDWNSTKTFLIDEAVALGADKTALEKCLSENRYSEKVKNQMNIWSTLFNVTWTPWNVIINNETWEYEILSWAYPTASFVTIIDKLLWE